MVGTVHIAVRSFQATVLSKGKPMITWQRTESDHRPSADFVWRNVAAQIAERSTCPDGARHGCVLVKDGYMIAAGYGSPARGVDPCAECWLRKKKRETGEKDWSVCPSVHAEVNVIATAARLGVSVEGAVAYITKNRPCDPCYRVLVNAGVAEFVGIDGVVRRL